MFNKFNVDYDKLRIISVSLFLVNILKICNNLNLIVLIKIVKFKVCLQQNLYGQYNNNYATNIIKKKI